MEKFFQDIAKVNPASDEVIFRAIFASVLDAIIAVDESQHIVAFNTAAEHMFGCGASDALRTPLHRFIPECLRSTHEESVRQFGESNETQRTMGKLREVFGLRSNGEKFPIEASISKIQIEETTFFTIILRDISERKQAQKKIRESEERYRSLVDHAPICIHEIDMNGHLTAMNPVGLQKQGATDKDNVTGQCYLDLVVAEDQERVAALFKEACLGRSVEFEFTAAQSPHPRVYASSFIPMKDASGNVTKITGVSQDITRQKEAESLLEGEKTILESIARGAPLADTLGLLCQTIETLCPRIRSSVLFLEGTKLRHGAAPSLPETYVQAVDGIRIGPCKGSCGTAAYRQEPVIVSDIATDPLWANDRDLALNYDLRSCWSAPIVSTNNCVLGTLAMYAHETGNPLPRELEVFYLAAHLAGIAIERNRTEIRIQENEIRFRTFLENCPVLAWIKDCDGRYEYVNPAWEATYQWTAASCVGKTDRDLWPQEIARPLREHDTTVLKKHVPLEAYESMPTPDGQTKDWLVLKFPVEGSEAKIESIAGFAIDVTQLNHLKRELHRAEQLAQLGTLAASLAHEIGTPMNIILGRGELLFRKTSEEPTKKGIKIIIEQVERVTMLINQLLNMSRRPPHQPRPLDLKKILHKVMSLVQEQARDTHTDIKKHWDDDVEFFIHGDGAHLEQVFLNLCVNAIHAMPEAGTLRLGLQASDGRIQAIVEDTGAGISQDNLSKIFDPFFTTKPKGKGTGLGLMIVQSIIAEHAGTITVDSIVGQGTTFTIALPSM